MPSSTKSVRSDRKASSTSKKAFLIYKSTKALTVPQEVNLHTMKRSDSKELKNNQTRTDAQSNNSQSQNSKVKVQRNPPISTANYSFVSKCATENDLVGAQSSITDALRSLDCGVDDGSQTCSSVKPPVVAFNISKVQSCIHKEQKTNLFGMSKCHNSNQSKEVDRMVNQDKELDDCAHYFTLGSKEGASTDLQLNSCETGE